MYMPVIDQVIDNDNFDPWKESRQIELKTGDKCHQNTCVCYVILVSCIA